MKRGGDIPLREREERPGYAGQSVDFHRLWENRHVAMVLRTVCRCSKREEPT